MKKEDNNIAEKELLEQQKYIDKLKEENEQFFKEKGYRKKYYTTTFGCP